MGKENRNGKRQKRSERTNRRKPELGYYLIVTDTKETEKVYFNGLRDSIKTQANSKLIIKVVETKSKNLVTEAKNFLSELPQYAEPWIVFDRDENLKFDSIIKEASKSNIQVAWSNPCIEIWFYAYFGKMPNYQTSTECCDEFGKEFQKHVNQKYKKSDDRIYSKLLTYGNENKAISLAEIKLQESINKNIKLPSKMIPSTTIHLLIKEIKSKL